jgi:hypothetical protein
MLEPARNDEALERGALLRQKRIGVTHADASRLGGSAWVERRIAELAFELQSFEPLGDHRDVGGGEAADTVAAGYGVGGQFGAPGQARLSACCGILMVTCLR